MTPGAMQWGTSSTFGHLNQSCGPQAHRSQQQRQQGQRTGGHCVHLSKISCGSDSKYIKYIYTLQHMMLHNFNCPHHHYHSYQLIIPATNQLTEDIVKSLFLKCWYLKALLKCAQQVHLICCLNTSA